MFKFISKQLIINMLSTWNHPDNWLPWINPTRTRDRADSKVKFHEKSTIHKEVDVAALGLRAGLEGCREKSWDDKHRIVSAQPDVV